MSYRNSWRMNLQKANLYTDIYDYECIENRMHYEKYFFATKL